MKENNYFWKTSSGALALLLVLPILAIFFTAVGETDQLFSHLMSTVMATYTYNTVVLVVGVMLLSLLFGIPCAWLMAMCRLPSERILQWALVLPLAMPAYIVGYIFTDWFDFAGPIQIALRDVMGWQAGDYWFPDIRTLGGAIIVLALVLYPYVYLLCRAAFMEQNVSLLQSARLLKCSPWQSFYRISLPLVRPAIAVGLSLVAMETIGDFGTVSYFAVNTLTTAVYDTWLGYSSLTAAAKISVIMLVFVILLLSLERYSRRKQKLFQSQFSSREDFRYELRGWKKWLALIWCWGLVAVAFIFPLGQLCLYAYKYFAQSWTPEFQQYALNSLYVSLSAAVIGVLIALVVNFYHRLSASRTSVLFMRLSSLGYAVPGTVLAIGVMVPVIFMDHAVNDLAKAMEWGRPGLIFSGSMFAIIFALVVRFSAVAIGSIESSLSKVSPSLDMASRTMGCNPNTMLLKVHVPLIRRGALIAALLVFIESMKELNASLLLRPFNFETLATYVFNYASDEHLELAAMPAVILVLVGLVPLVLINRSLEQVH
ncbi:iron ABC transporter permease [Vibrio scophthalmi]|mgnify:CR=1 FL=1|uniref:Fe(3+)-transport system permease protein FbpB n=2 Tax=Vibrio scophthalmi TaxID=45658 RepID=A0A1B1NLD0_9VIBR|nr:MULTISPECIES: iron ABC transporter permease [Vibrio]ANS84493.1 Fe(3+)-transport system permease protein FbpB [Vibrio scophthalmi]ANU37396.1 Fe(3+)-transport system permease protein FbpB [Vibrio scophthalmi]EGU34942.1 iron(III) ABC transporter, permease protein [Vibrio sp. N418]EGU41109.1 iron(III) ABC transporter, permease protein [Vibrio scophthalmi LMG 19158]ODS12338.1 Fe(3+)-transport system permease protein FbpB [Vibrio scophthalmi]